MKNGYVYINTNKYNTVLYVGVTANLEGRAYEHKYRLDPPKSFCYKYWVTKLVYYECFEDITDAIHREKQLKNLTRKKKLHLINTMNPEWVDLYKGLFE
jgi:putative endonuclease